MLSTAADVDVPPPGSEDAPPLQEKVRLVWPVISGSHATPQQAQAIQTYLRDACASMALAQRVLQHTEGEDAASLFGASGAHGALEAVESREKAAAAAAATTAAHEMKAAQAVCVEARAMAEPLASSGAARLSRLVAAEANGGLIACTMTLGGGAVRGTHRLELRTHRLAAVAVAPFLTAMRAAAESGAVAGLLHAADSGIRFLHESCDRRSECCCFGALELCRHLSVHLYALGSPGDIVQHVCNHQRQALIMSSLMDGIVPYEGQLRDDVDELRTQRQQADQVAECVRSITRLVQDYCVFFHVTTSVAEGLSERFSAMASAFHPGDGAVYGTARFPRARHCILHRDAAGDYRTKTGRCAIDGRRVNPICPAFSPEARMQDKVMPTATAGRLPLVAQLLTLVVAPASHIAAFLLLSAVASLPLSAALDVAVTVSETHELCQRCAPLAALVKAMWGGRLGEVWALSQRVAVDYLAESREPLMRSTTLKALMAQLRRSLCYQYASTRSVVDLHAAAAHLGLAGGASELQAELEPLIVAGRLPMRINAVDKRLTRVLPPTAVDPRAAAERALDNSRLSVAETELTLRHLAVQRCLAQPTSCCLPVASPDISWWKHAEQGRSV